MSFEKLGLREFNKTAMEITPEFDPSFIKKVIPFGISYLDRMTYGILPDDLVLIGAPSGVGKSELATQLAFNAAKIGKRVVFFALEYAPGEVELRTKYRLYMNCIELDKGKLGLVGVNYLDFRLGKMAKVIAPYRETVETFLNQITNMKVYYREKNFGLHEFIKVFNSVNSEADLIIIDHLHYFDIEDENENRAIADIMKKIKDLNQQTGIPVVMVGHLRKSNKQDKSLVAGLDDFHGTSNIGKVSTKVITLSPGEMINNHRFQTYFRFAKCREFQPATKYVGLGVFNSDKNEYEKEFAVGKLTHNEKEFTACENKEIPRWYIDRGNK